MIGFLQSALTYIAPIVFVLGLVVTVHELGHFLAAKWLGTAIERFSIGFGRPLFAWVDRSGVEWRVGWIPLGGYVKFAGDDNAASVPDSDDLEALRRDLVAREGEGALSRYFHFKPLWQRAVIVAAGPTANFLLSTVIFAGLLLAFGEMRSPVRVDAIRAGSPAEAAGFRIGDVILKADGRALHSLTDLKQVVMLKSGTPTAFLVDRGGRTLDLTATPRRTVIVDELGRQQRLGQLGVENRLRAQDVTIKRFNPIEALGGGAERTWDVLTTTLSYLGRMFTGREAADQLSGPLGMAQLSGDITKKTAEVSADAGGKAVNVVASLLGLAASISVGIGFLNLLPVPVLDGGHLLFYGYEAVARRPLTAKVQAAGYRVGLALVLGLMVFATWNDLQRLRVFNLFGSLIS